jgi:hypothetical protein
MRLATVGVVVLVHQDLSRSAQAVRHWAEAGCAVVVHVDRAVTVSDVPWSIGGLHKERFHLHFPFAWKRRRWLFDLSVRIQRTLGLKRRLPRGIIPHLGSQWWCLTRSTISAILNDPKRPIFERYFRRV